MSSRMRTSSIAASTGVHIFLHILVITSFLLLSLTGLPLKFSTQPWAVAMMKMYGGAANAALLHRVCAVITFVYFGAALVMSFNFLLHQEGYQGQSAPAAVRS